LIDSFIHLHYGEKFSTYIASQAAYATSSALCDAGRAGV